MNKLRLAVSFLGWIFVAASCNTQTITIHGHRVNIEVAQTPKQQEQGLGDRDSLGVNDGMLFVFDNPGQPGFWMKGMRFDLDFIWINNGQVVQITARVPAQTAALQPNLTIYRPNSTVDMVLEVNAGWAERNSIQVGDRVDGLK